MPDLFTYDVFLSHCSADKPIVQEIAERLKNDGLKVWFDGWEIKVGDPIPHKIEEGLQQSRVLVLCLSENARKSDWASLESGTFRYRDPLNKDRRFVPLRLDTAPVEGSLAQFRAIDWASEVRHEAYRTLLETCRPRLTQSADDDRHVRHDRLLEKIISLAHTDSIRSVAFSPDGRHALTGSADRTVRMWEVETGRCERVLEGHADSVTSVSFSPDGQRALSGSDDNTVRVWEINTARCECVLDGHAGAVRSVSFSPDGRHALSGSNDQTVRMWEIETGRCERVLDGHAGTVYSVSFSPDGRRALSGSNDQTVRVWEIETGCCERTFAGHKGTVRSVSFSPDGRRALSGSADKTVRVWKIETGHCERVLDGHKGTVRSVSWSPDGQRALSGSVDNTVQVWEIETGHCERKLDGHTDSVYSVSFSPDGRYALSGSEDNTVRMWKVETGHCERLVDGRTNAVFSLSFSPDGRRALSGSADHTVRVWEVETGRCERVLYGHKGAVYSVSWSADGRRALSGSNDYAVRVWEVETGHCECVLDGHTGDVTSVSWSPDGQHALSGSADKTVRVWDLEAGRCECVLDGHTGTVRSVSFSPDGRRALSGAVDKKVRVWEIETGRCERVLNGHTNSVCSVSFSPDGLRALSGSADQTLRVWELETGRCERVLEGHMNSIYSVSFSPDGQRALSGSVDNTVRVWEVETGRCERVLDGHTSYITSVWLSPDGQRALSATSDGVMRIWDLADSTTDAPLVNPQFQYTNAKVLLVGDSGVGKTGLSRYLTQGLKIRENELHSTDGAWATHWPLVHTSTKPGTDREIWLWDFAGQVDYRLVHQLFMDDTAAAVLVFDPQDEKLFEGLGQWDRDLHKATRQPFGKLLTAGRIDRGGLIVSADSVNKFMNERGFRSPLHTTSAVTGAGCEQLRQAIVDAIDWKNIPETTSPALYHRLKQEILALRDSGLVLIQRAALKQRLEMTLRGEDFEPNELDAVLGLLSGPGMIQKVDFGGHILLRPEVLSRYAAAVVRKVRSHPQELGCISEDEFLAGYLDYQDFRRLPTEDEAVVLRTLLEHLLSRAWCLRQPCDGPALLIFPSYFRRERKEQPSHPSVMVTYRFDGPTDEVYATLVVRLHHTVAFTSTNLWKSAADFKTQTGAALGFTLLKEAEGTSRLEVYFEPEVSQDSQVVFLRYIHEHLMQHAQNVRRLRHYACGNSKCTLQGKQFADQTAIDRALAPGGKGRVFCSDCGKPIALRDVIEERFDSPAVKEQVRELAKEAQTVIDSESLELVLVGHAFSIAAQAGQIFRLTPDGDNGLFGEIVFKDDQGRESEKRLYVQFKTDSYLTKRPRDGADIIHVKHLRWAACWQRTVYGVMLVVRTGDVIRWMDVSEYLIRESGKINMTRQIAFEGERFDVMSVRRWRDKLLGPPT